MPKSLARVKRLSYPRVARLLRLLKTLLLLSNDTCTAKEPTHLLERYQARAQAAHLTIATIHCLVLREKFPSCDTRQSRIQRSHIIEKSSPIPTRLSSGHLILPRQTSSPRPLRALRSCSRRATPHPPWRTAAFDGRTRPKGRRYGSSRWVRPSCDTMERN
jgi:hypothetical protein